MSAGEEKAAAVGIPTLLDEFFDAQLQRVAVYRQLQTGFEQFMRSGAVSDYQDMCAATTSHFARISGTVQQLQKELRDEGRPDLADLLRAVQMGEKRKLQATAKQHMLLQSQLRWKPWTDEWDAAGVELGELRRDIAVGVEEINDALVELRAVAAALAEDGSGDGEESKADGDGDEDVVISLSDDEEEEEEAEGDAATRSEEVLLVEAAAEVVGDVVAA
eukprot:PLAT9484.1.p1 GENE.PLAT9484.1~~PLAT9484.1.p1  ORF type:complete len:227 (+),score=107.48 PLAT9484.1:26-682(+)